MKTAISAKNTIRYIPFKKLCASPANVRVVSPSKSSDKQLMASILAHGLIQNLVVVPSVDTEGMFEVIAGGRRFAALKALVEQDKIEDNYEVFCSVKESEATAISLSENLKESMHPVDEFIAYKKLFDDGKSEKTISLEFGVSTSRVKQLLKLGSVAPDIINASRLGKLTLECLMAFTVTDDHERQVACLKELGRGHINAYAIRSYLLKNTLCDDDAIVKFIGFKEYKNAGGAVTTDLFQSKTYLLDVSLVENLANNKLKTEAATIEKEGWKWVEFSLEGFDFFRGLHTLTAEFGKLPAKLVKEIEHIKSEISALEDMDVDDWTPEDEERLNQLESKMELLEEERESFRNFSKEQKAFSGARITFDYEGKLIMRRGLVKKEDMQKPKHEENSSPVSQDNENLESAALVTDLNNYYCQAVQAELLNHDELAHDLMVYTLVNSVVDNVVMSRILSIDINKREPVALGIDSTVAASKLSQYESSLNISWVMGETEAEKFTLFCALPKKDKTKLLTFCVARTCNVSPRHDYDGMAKVIAEKMQFNIAGYWKPTKENYFSRVKRDVLLNIGESVSEDFRKQHEKAKKAELAAYMETMKELEGWLPDIYQPLNRTQE